MTQLAERPIFIVGHPRSGTTLLRFLLSSHPRIYIPEETGFLPFLVPDREIEADLSLARVEQILERIGRLNRLWRGLVPDVPGFYQALPEPKLRHLLDALYKQQVASRGAARWGDKTPLYVRYIPTLDRIFPTAQFIHLIRDGRDAALSAREKWPGRRPYMDPYYLLKHWVRNVETGRTAGRALGGGRYLELRYEALVQDPRSALVEVCTFLGETFHPHMLDHVPLARQVGPGPQDHVEVLQPISTASTGRWKGQMSPFEQKLADRLAAPTLRSLGYELAGLGPFSAGERTWGFFLAAKFLLLDSARRLLYALGLLTLNRGMRR